MPPAGSEQQGARQNSLSLLAPTLTSLGAAWTELRGGGQRHCGFPRGHR